MSILVRRLVAVLAVLAGSAGMAHAEPRLIQKVYPVADLVVPIPGYHGRQPMASGLSGAVRACTEGSVIQASWIAAPAPRLSKPGPLPTQEHSLIKLITQTVDPTSWIDEGGPGEVEYFPLNMSLVITQTENAHAQIAEMLESMRHLFEVSVGHELRLITVPAEVYREMAQHLPEPIVAEDGTETRFFAPHETQQFFQALHSDPRTNVLAAPKVTTIDTQEATVQCSEQVGFVTGIDLQRNGATLQATPKVEYVEPGFYCTMLPRISADRHYVDLEIDASYTKLDGVAEMAYVHVIAPTSAGPVAGQTGPFTQAIQMPQVSSTKMKVKVMVPNQRTVVLSRPPSNAEAILLMITPYIIDE